MRILIVDDEPVARKILREELELLDSVEIVGEADNGETALEKISSSRPDIVFLDVQMPVMSGFELIAHLNSGHLPAIIMVTAYDLNVIQAFEAGRVNYLLKPISQQRLVHAMECAKRNVRSPVQLAENLAHLQDVSPIPKQTLPNPRKIVGKLGDEYCLLSLSDVQAFQAEGDITWISTAKQRYLTTQNLRAIEQRLQNTSFRRIHTNAIVNVEQIRKLSEITGQRWLVTLNNGEEFVVSKPQAKSVRDVLKW